MNHMYNQYVVGTILDMYYVQGRQTLDNIGGAHSLGSGGGSLKFWRGRGVIFTKPFLLHFYATIFSKICTLQKKKYFFQKKIMHMSLSRLRIQFSLRTYIQKSKTQDYQRGIMRPPITLGGLILDISNNIGPSKFYNFITQN